MGRITTMEGKIVRTKLSLPVMIVACIVTAVATLFASQKGMAQQESQLAPEVRFVAAGVADARERLKCAQAVVSMSEFLPKAYLESLPDALKPKDKTLSDTTV